MAEALQEGDEDGWTIPGVTREVQVSGAGRGVERHRLDNRR